jgi:hypothetical protein
LPVTIKRTDTRLLFSNKPRTAGFIFMEAV